MLLRYTNPQKANLDESMILEILEAGSSEFDPEYLIR